MQRIVKFCVLMSLLLIAASHFEVASKSIDNQYAMENKQSSFIDYISSLIFGDYYDDDDDFNEEYLICRNCTVVINKPAAEPVPLGAATVPSAQPALPAVQPPPATVPPPPAAIPIPAQPAVVPASQAMVPASPASVPESPAAVTESPAALPTLP